MSENSNKEQIEAPLNSSAIDMSLSMQQTSISSMTNPNELKRSVKIQELPSAVLNNHVTPAGISRERSFVRASNPQNYNIFQNMNKRRSMGFQQQIRMKPALEIYRPPNIRMDIPQNKLNVHAQEFTMGMQSNMGNNRSSLPLYNTSSNLQHSKSSGNMQMQIAQHNRQVMHQLQQQRLLLGGSHPLQMNSGIIHQASHMPLVNSPSSGNILHQSSPRVKFAPEPIIHQSYQQPVSNGNSNNNVIINNMLTPLPLQRSKSMSSADALTRGIASLGLGLSVEDIGPFSPEIMGMISEASDDPNQLNARCLMELATHCMNRAIEGRRYSLPISRLCISIISKEQKETFLEALLNLCRQYYQERDKVLGSIPNSKNPSRPRFTAFMAFLTEMFCQLKRRQLQLRTQCDGISPPLVLLTLLGKCCEDCVKSPVRSLSEIECLFFVLTCIGKDLEMQIPQQLETLFINVRDAFLNSSASQPAVRRTLLQLIELQASKWQLPCNTVLYYYPSSK
ncbi:unnamed protein product [Chironomus riparius]|uniref:MIF4G domain-containing protein n=1 Tax=Chironomus riparius TaxID=315576 RepID=A0A9N9RLK6_9DIPT|nr:unnamed protein product [Chironomus riparius]